MERKYKGEAQNKRKKKRMEREKNEEYMIEIA